MRRALKLALVLAVAGAAFAPGTASAACSLNGTTGIAFGVYNPLSGTPVETTGSVDFTCVLLSIFDLVYIDLGTGMNSTTFAGRKLRNGTATLNYQLYYNAARTQVWGDGTGGTAHYGPLLPLLGAMLSLPVYGRLPAGQAVTVGTYTDTIVVTMVY